MPELHATVGRAPLPEIRELLHLDVCRVHVELPERLSLQLASAYKAATCQLFANFFLRPSVTAPVFPYRIQRPPAGLASILYFSNSTGSFSSFHFPVISSFTRCMIPESSSVKGKGSATRDGAESENLPPRSPSPIPYVSPEVQAEFDRRMAQRESGTTVCPGSDLGTTTTRNSATGETIRPILGPSTIENNPGCTIPSSSSQSEDHTNISPYCDSPIPSFPVSENISAFPNAKLFAHPSATVPLAPPQEANPASSSTLSVPTPSRTTATAAADRTSQNRSYQRPSPLSIFRGRDMRFHCPFQDCSHVASTPGNLNRHLITHKAKSQCRVCGTYLVPRRDNLRRHCGNKRNPKCLEYYRPNGKWSIEVSNFENVDTLPPAEAAVSHQTASMALSSGSGPQHQLEQDTPPREEVERKSSQNRSATTPVPSAAFERSEGSPPTVCILHSALTLPDSR